MPLNNYDDIRRAYIAGYDAGDAGAIAGIFTDDCVIVPPEQPALTGKEGVRSYSEAQFTAFNMALSINTEEVVVLGDWGYGRGTWKNTLTPKAGGDAVEIEGKYLNIVKREADGGWKIHRHIWNTPTPMVMPAS